MPYARKRKAKVFRKRRQFRRRRTTFKRKGRRGNLRINSKKIYGVFPDTTITALKSTLLQSGVATSAGTGGYTLATVATSIVDPFGTGSTNEQATGLDQYSAFYRRYRVVGCKLKIQVFSADTDDFLELILFPSVGIFTEASFATRDPTTLPFCKDVMLYPNTARTCKTQQYMTTKKMFPGENTKSDLYTGSCVQGSFTSPSSPWYMNFRVINTFNQASAATFSYKLNMTQYVQFYERADITVSEQ